VADGGDPTRLGLGFGADVSSRFATTCEAVGSDGAFGAGSPSMTSSTASGSAAAKTSHGGAGRKPAVARNNVNPAMCNRMDVIIATTSSNTGHERERVAVTAWARGAFFGVGGTVMSPGYRVVPAAVR
jgi:hypothetical protein